MKKNVEILYEDNHLIAVNKNSGDLSQGDHTGDVTLIDRIKSYIKKKYDKPGNVFLGSIHRLDRPVSGLILFAKTSKSLERMAKAFRDRKVKKYYIALIDGFPDSLDGELTNYIEKNSAKNKSYVVKANIKTGKKSILKYRLLQDLGNKGLILIEPITGRHHQIRVQLAHIGCPIVGDLKYGYPKANRDQSICLHCICLEYMHPVKKEKQKLFAPIPSIPEWEKINLTDIDFQ